MAYGLEVKNSSGVTVLSITDRLFRRIGTATGVAASQVGSAAHYIPGATGDGTTFTIVYNGVLIDVFWYVASTNYITVHWNATWDLGMYPVSYTINVFKG